MSYDDWKTDPDYEENILRRMREEDLKEAIRLGYHIYDYPIEAHLCNMARGTYRGLRYGEKFIGIPYPERGNYED